MIGEFGLLAARNTRCKKPVAHLSFSLSKGEHLEAAQWAELAERVAKDYGFEQYTAIRHHDTDCEHIHVVGNRIKLDGKKCAFSKNSTAIAVFGLLKRGGKVYTAIIPNAKTETLLPIIQEKVQPDSIVYTDTFSAYNALDVSDFHHSRINHSELFADKQNHINGIENFWNQAKRHLRRFNGIKPDNFYYFLKECEWRFNAGSHRALLRQLKHWYSEAKH